ncbi:hypothetical protein RhiirC2_775778 [Rhizophagus irregularis]|uniref:Uncharacterized protein n=1 Tax=Rhizophagus irregularis TaxID=588596 RepID=A0A2N1NI87_9GLOM|nr:hypothetical protein RhiirC2_775778 [Rhizophagus irregularis]
MEEIYTCSHCSQSKAANFSYKISIIELDELKQIITEKIRVNDHNCFYEISQKNKTCIAFSNTNVINNGSIQNNEEIKDGELIFAELETYLDEA